MLVAVNEALLVTVRLAFAALVNAPAETRVRLLAVLVPVNNVELSSLMLTAPPLLKVSEPKLKVSPAWLPRSMLVAVNEALLVTVRLAFAALVKAPAETRVRLLA